MWLNTPEYQFKTACDIAELTINGSQPQDPQIYDSQKFYEALKNNPFLALGEWYAAQHYDVDDLWKMIQSFAKAEMTWEIQKLFTLEQKLKVWLHYIWWKLNLNRFRQGQSRIADDHYDLDTPLKECTLGSTMKYTSAFYYPQYGTFDLRLFQKLDLAIAGMRMWLQEGDTLCDIGFGFWSNPRYFVENFGVKVTGITISKEQKLYAEYLCRDISDHVKFILMDYRDMTPENLGTFDHVCFFEMIESIGWPKNFLEFFQRIKNILNKNGNVFGQVLSRNEPSKQQNDWIDRSHATEPFIGKYIFKWGVLPRLGSLIKSSEQSGLYPRIIDNSLGRANGETCKAWNNNFQNWWKQLSESPDELLWITKGEKYIQHFQDRFPYKMNIDTFRRIWEYYLLSCYGWHTAWLINDGHYVWENNPEHVSIPDIQIPKTREEVIELLNE